MEETPKPGSIVHVEIPCKDVKRAKAFYGGIFGWKFEDVPEMEYTLFNPANPPGGGMYIPQEGMPGGIMNYLLVDSIEETAERIESHGGKILVPKREVPGRAGSPSSKIRRGTPSPCGRALDSHHGSDAGSELG